jgi:transcriptional regulator with XRE-family HTH domain
MTELADQARRIREARRERGLTQEQLAEATGVSRSAVAQWETGRAGQITGNLSRIATILGISVEWLLYGANKKAPAEAASADELALLRLYRECSPTDRHFLLTTARRLAILSQSGTVPAERQS